MKLNEKFLIMSVLTFFIHIDSSFISNNSLLYIIIYHYIHLHFFKEKNIKI